MGGLGFKKVRRPVHPAHLGAPGSSWDCTRPSKGGQPLKKDSGITKHFKHALESSETWAQQCYKQHLSETLKSCEPLVGRITKR